MTHTQNGSSEELQHSIDIQPVLGSNAISTPLHKRRKNTAASELNHRVRNTLATVQSICSLTLRSSGAPPELRNILESRIMALSKFNDLVMREQWTSVALKDVVEAALAAHFYRDCQSPFSLAGDAVRLHSRHVVIFGMAFHELAANAVKYGALRGDRGHVDITWRMDDEHLCLKWQERDGPPIDMPSHKGFGTRLIERTLPAEVGGISRVSYPRTGMMCEIHMPVTELHSF